MRRSRCDACQGLLEVAGYTIEAPLGAGGTSRVFSGRRVSDGTPVAIKVLELSKTSDWKSYDLFVRGTQTLQTLSHPGLPRVYAFERDEQGRLYQVRERFEGGTLRERVERLNGLPSAAAARQLLISLLRVLQFLHGRLPPIVHRDIKPSNVMFRKADSWEPVLIDFESMALAQASTGTTIVVSPGYTAPEQLAGRASAQSDLYSLAATFVYACTGREPDDAPRGPRAALQRYPGLDATSAAVLNEMIESIPEQRLASANEALRRLYQTDAALAQLSEVSRVARVGKWVLTLGAIALVFFGAVSISGAARLRQFKAAMSNLGLDLDRTSDRVIIQSAKGEAADIGIGLDACTVTRHRLHGESYGSLRTQLEAIEGRDRTDVRPPAAGDAYVVLACDVTAYPSLPLNTKHAAFTFRSQYGIPTN